MVSRGYENDFRRNVSTKYGIILPSNTKALIWLIGFAVLAGLTIKDFLPLLSDYTDNNVATNVDVVVLDEEFKPPQPVLGIPHYKLENRDMEGLITVARHLYTGSNDSCDLCDQLRNASWDVWKDMNVVPHRNSSQWDLVTYYNALSLAFARKLLDDMDMQVFNETHSPWKEVIFSAVVNFYIWHSESDYLLRQYDIGPGLSHTMAFDAHDNASKMDRIFSRVLSRLCDVFDFIEMDRVNDFSTGAPTNRTCRNLLLDSTVPVIIDKNALWLALPALDRPSWKEYVFRSPTNRSAVSDWTWLAHGDELKLFWLYPDVSIQYVLNTDTTYSSYLLQTPFGQKGSTHKITIKYDVQMRTRETRSSSLTCDKGTSAAACFTKCTKQYTIDQCGCVPFTVKKGLADDSDLPYCNPAIYASCNGSSITAEERKACRNKCKVACEYTSYGWQIGHVTSENKYANVSELRLIIIPMFNTFVDFSWTYKNTPEQFLSQIGGILNFYLGFSGLSLFAFIIMCIDVIKRLKNRKAGPVDRIDLEHGTWSQATTIFEKTASVRSFDGQQDAWIEKLKAELRAELIKELGSR